MIKFLQIFWEIAFGALLGLITGMIAASYSRRVMRDSQMFLLISTSSLMSMSLINHNLRLPHSFYPAYCIFCIYFRNQGSSQYQIRQGGDSILWELITFFDYFSENCLFFLFGMLFYLSGYGYFYPSFYSNFNNSQDPVDAYQTSLFSLLINSLIVVILLQGHRFLTLLIGNQIFLSELSKKETMDKIDLYFFTLSEKYSNFSVIILLIYFNEFQHVSHHDYLLV